MLYYPRIDPVAFQLGPIKVHWYGLMYLIGFIAAWALGRLRVAKLNSGWTSEQLSDLIFYAAVGVIVGGRLGYMLFYDFGGFMDNPLTLFQVWRGGMAFHGGLIGVAIALWFYSYKIKKSVWELTDFAAPLVPIGLAVGRIGNFINGELWGRVTTVSWGVIYPNAGILPRHPSEIYECFFEGVLLFIILWCFSSKPRPRFAVSAMFLLFYGMFRFSLEFFRQPDPQLGFIALNWLTMGQILSVPMILVGGLSLYWVYYRRDKH